jgi:hypothetical protein
VENFSENCLSSDRDSNLGPSEYEPEVVITLFGGLLAMPETTRKLCNF